MVFVGLCCIDLSYMDQRQRYKERKRIEIRSISSGTVHGSSHIDLIQFFGDFGGLEFLSFLSFFRIFFYCMENRAFMALYSCCVMESASVWVPKGR